MTKRSQGEKLVAHSQEKSGNMKQAFVSALQAEQDHLLFSCLRKRIRATREGKSYLRLELGDRTGTIEARMWGGFERDAASFERDDFVKVQAASKATAASSRLPSTRFAARKKAKWTRRFLRSHS